MICQNPDCDKKLVKYQKKYCSVSCAAKTTTPGRKHSLETKQKISNSLGGSKKYLNLKKRKTCQFCHKQLIKSQLKYCNNNCRHNYEFQITIQKWLNGEIEGNSQGGHARWVKRFLLIKYNDKCSRCGWGETNTYTKSIPLEVEHIDGNAYNNNPNNVTLICPNCQSLTKTYRGANRGNGRRKYLKKYYYHKNEI